MLTASPRKESDAWSYELRVGKGAPSKGEARAEGVQDWLKALAGARATAFLPGKPVHTLTLIPSDSLN